MWKVVVAPVQFEEISAGLAVTQKFVAAPLLRTQDEQLDLVLFESREKKLVLELTVGYLLKAVDLVALVYQLCGLEHGFAVSDQV